MNDEFFTLSQYFKSLGDETRLRLVALLAQQEPDNALCVGRLARELETTASNVSQHLRVLKNLGLVYSERRGYNLHYFLNPDQLGGYRQLISKLLGSQFLPNELTFTPNKEQNPMSKKQNCAHPKKNLSESDCTPEQIQECHGDVEKHPCECDCHGQDQPCDCNQEQRQDCHGDGAQHLSEKV